MKVQLPTRTIEVKIHHRRPDLKKDAELIMSPDFREMVRVNCPSTLCEVFLENGSVFTGNAYCAPGDKFVKRKGLAMSVKRALLQTNLSRSERTMVYNVLFGKVVA